MPVSAVAKITRREETLLNMAFLVFMEESLAPKDDCGSSLSHLAGCQALGLAEAGIKLIGKRGVQEIELLTILLCAICADIPQACASRTPESLDCESHTLIQELGQGRSLENLTRQGADNV